jgi:hypothetical protein
MVGERGGAVATFIGANVEELRDLASTFDANGQALERTARDLTARVTTSSWVGSDQQRFIDDWHSRLRMTLLGASSSLLSTAHLLRQNAAEQEAASGVGGSIQSPVFAQGDSDKPGNPDGYGDMGERVDWPDSINTSPATISKFFVAQGQVGDCWFLAALGAVAKQNPEFLSEQMQQNDDGTWTVTFYDDGKPVEITVNPHSPDGSAGNYSGEPNWATIYEKAAAEFFGGDYEDLDNDTSDRAFEAITGNSSDSRGELSISEIQDALENGPVALGTEAGDGDFFLFDKVDEAQIVPNHAYIVDDVAMREGDDGVEQLMIHVINPWGPGGSLDGQSKWGDQWLTEEQYHDNFDSVYTGTVG